MYPRAGCGCGQTLSSFYLRVLVCLAQSNLRFSFLKRLSEAAPPCKNLIGLRCSRADDAAQGFQTARKVRIISLVYFTGKFEQYSNGFDRTEIVVHGGVEAAGVVGWRFQTIRMRRQECFST